MSWDIVLFNSRQKIADPADVDETQLVPVDFGAVFKSNFENIRQSEGYCSIEEDGFSIEYSDYGEPESVMLLHLYGEKAIYSLIDLAIKNNWQIFDTGHGEMIDLQNPAQNGYGNFQAYLNHVLKNNT
jgi:hypothetical protein